MNKKKDIPQDIIDKYVPRYDSGEMSCNDVSKATGYSRFQWKTVLLRAGVYRDAGTSRWSDKHTERAAELYKEMSLKEVAKVMDFSTTYVRAMLQQNGIPLRDPHKTKRNKKEHDAQASYNFGKYESFDLRKPIMVGA